MGRKGQQHPSNDPSMGMAASFLLHPRVKAFKSVDGKTRAQVTSLTLLWSMVLYSPPRDQPCLVL